MLFKVNYVALLCMLCGISSMLVGAVPVALPEAQRHDPNKENIDPNGRIDWLGIAQTRHATGGTLGTGYGG